MRVPNPDVSLVDLSVNLKSKVSKESINEAFYKAQEGAMKGLIIVDDEQRVSSDFIGSSASAIIVSDKSIAIDKSAKILAWYDNEMGYTHRLVDMSVYVCRT